LFCSTHFRKIYFLGKRAQSRDPRARETLRASNDSHMRADRTSAKYLFSRKRSPLTSCTPHAREISGANVVRNGREGQPCR
jgi:hypothetical protein